MANVRKFLDLSTEHLTEEMRIQLNCMWLREGNLATDAFCGVVIHATEYGGLMWVPDDPQESSLAGDEDAPPELLAIQLHARKHGCDYVMFDRDAEADPELPTFDEAAAA